MSPMSPMSPKDMARLRARLTEQETGLREEIEAHRRALGEPAAATGNTFIAGNEGAVADADDERELALLGHAQQQLDAVTAALRRLDDGSYGDCESCARTIGLQRLLAVPEARLCLACQEQAEGGK